MQAPLCKTFQTTNRSLYRNSKRVKTDKHTVKKCLASVLVLVYLFVALVYISYLPTYNLVERHSPIVAKVMHLHKSDGATNAAIQFHFKYQSVINKGNVLGFIKVMAAAIALFYSSLGVANILAGQKFYLHYFYTRHQENFLNFCMLRI
jgi:hypothetical protein